MEFDFATELEKLDTVPEAFRPLYQEAEGKFKLDERFTGVASAVTGLNKALRAERKSPRVDLSGLAEYGTNPEEIRTGISKRMEELKIQLAEGGKGSLEKLRKEFAEQHGLEIKKLSTRNDALQGQLYTYLVENTASQAIVDAKGDPSLVMPFVKDRVKVAEENGKMVVYVVDEAGERAYSAVTGQPKTVKELVLELKALPKFGRLFDSEAPTGGGMGPKGGAKPPLRKDPKEMSAVDKISAGLKKGLAVPKNKERHL